MSNRINNNSSNQNEESKPTIKAEFFGSKEVKDIEGVDKNKLEIFSKLSDLALECSRAGLSVGIIAIEAKTKISKVENVDIHIENREKDLVLAKLYITKALVDTRSPSQVGQIINQSFGALLKNQSITLVDTHESNENPENPEDPFKITII